MPHETRSNFIAELQRRFGVLRKLAKSQSLFEIGERRVRLYLRYSKVHQRDRTFYGLRLSDLKALEGHPSFICFLWDRQAEPLLIPFSEYEEVFHSTRPAPDGQFKTQVYLRKDGTELYIANAGRFNVESHFGWPALDTVVSSSGAKPAPDLSHSQVQTLLGAIGITKGHDVWIPPQDQCQLDWKLTRPFGCARKLPGAFRHIEPILQAVDVLWLKKGATDLTALFEVEHSTPIYSGLLRFNDIHLAMPDTHARFSIVGKDARREAFARQLNRPTFQASGLAELCNFLDYVNVYGWYQRTGSPT